MASHRDLCALLVVHRHCDKLAGAMLDGRYKSAHHDTSDDTLVLTYRS